MFCKSIISVSIKSNDSLIFNNISAVSINDSHDLQTDILHIIFIYIIKMSYAKYLTIRSIDRINNPGASSTNFQIQLKEGIPAVKSVELISFLCPNAIYKIRANINNYFVWSRSSTNYYIVIPPASYSISSLITYIQQQMNAQDSNSYTLTFNQDSMTVTISGTSAFVLNWGSSPYSNYT